MLLLAAAFSLSVISSYFCLCFSPSVEMKFYNSASPWFKISSIFVVSTAVAVRFFYSAAMSDASFELLFKSDFRLILCLLLSFFRCRRITCFLAVLMAVSRF